MIVVGGENLIDFIESADGSFSANVGGGPFNIAKTLALQGQDTGYLTPISTDSMGTRLAATLTNTGVTLLAPRSKSASSLALVTLENGQPRYQFYREKTAERRVSLALLNRIIPKQARALQLGSLAITTGRDADIWAQIYVASKKRGIFTSLDPNIRPAFIKNRRKYMARLAWVMAHTDLLKMSDEDIGWLAPDTQPEAAAKALRDQHSIPLLVLTKGAEGAVAFYASGDMRAPASPAVPFMDAVGAGDTFMGTLLAQLSEQGLLAADNLAGATPETLETCLAAAGLAAAMNCETTGCNPPDRAALAVRQSPGRAAPRRP